MLGPLAAEKDEVEVDEASSPAEAGLPPAVTLVGIPESVATLCGSCVQYVWQALKAPLDFTGDTLSVLDHYITSVRRDLLGKPEALELVATVVGAYFGEVVRRRHAGFWLSDTPSVHDWQLRLRPVFLWFNPIGVAHDAIHGTTEHGGPRSHLRVTPEDSAVVEARLAAVPPVPEEEYTWLTTRLEAIDAAVEALRWKMSQQGYRDAEFTEADYAAELLQSFN
jgi:hypothetical protein